MLAQADTALSHPYKQVRDQVGVALYLVMLALQHPTRHLPLDYPVAFEAFVDNLLAKLGTELGASTGRPRTDPPSPPLIQSVVIGTQSSDTARCRRSGTASTPARAARGSPGQPDALRAARQDRCVFSQEHARSASCRCRGC